MPMMYVPINSNYTFLSSTRYTVIDPCMFIHAPMQHPACTRWCHPRHATNANKSIPRKKKPNYSIRYTVYDEPRPGFIICIARRCPRPGPAPEGEEHMDFV